MNSIHFLRLSTKGSWVVKKAENLSLVNETRACSVILGITLLLALFFVKLTKTSSIKSIME